MGLFSSSKSSSTNDNADKRIGVGNDALAPIAGAQAQQANAAGSTAVSFSGGKGSSLSIDNSVTDSRNFGVDLGNTSLGAGASVLIEDNSEEIALGALQSNIDVSRTALELGRQSTLGAYETALRLGDMQAETALRLGEQQAAAGTANADRMLLATLAATDATTAATGMALQSNIDVSRTALELGRQSTLGGYETALRLGGMQADTTRAALAGNQNVSLASLAASNEAFARSLDSSETVSLAALDANTTALDTALAYGARLADSQDSAARAQHAATLEMINAARESASTSARTSENIVTDALGKLAEQRAPEGVNLTRALTWIALAAAAAWVLRGRKG